MQLGKCLPHSRKGCPNQIEKKLTGKDWLTPFLKCNTTMSLWKPEVISIGGMSTFNHHNVEMFHNNVLCLKD